MYNASCIMPLWVENYFRLSLLIICTMNLESLKSEILLSILSKLTPFCRNEDVFFLTVLATISVRCFSDRVFL